MSDLDKYVFTQEQHDNGFADHLSERFQSFEHVVLYQSLRSERFATKPVSF